ncbi:hypothetical protein NLU13_3924 [Sarocladium strictum]|uniref:V-snare n=1 Tax=Sarocladium strictum TaxID=5046 RepID=A0AA39L8G4_SARSR|nr:hypothetical protein NLU13_3924 [Sarocladium strictum]
MSHKRELDQDYDDDASTSPPVSKRVKKHDSNKSKSKHHHQNAHIDPTWGQKYVFSSHENATTIPAGEESDFEDDADAMAYLMSVRHEATEIPHLLVAPKIQIGPQLPAELETANGDTEPCDDAFEEGEYRTDDDEIYAECRYPSKGYYEDGAYFDLDDEDFEDGQAIENDTDPSKATHDAYFSSLMRSYLALRDIVNTTPPKNASERLSSSHLTHAAPFGRSSHTSSTWTNILVTLDPHPLQLALLSKDSVILILRVLLGGQLLRRGRDIPERTSRWLWGLLARLPEPGELTHWELGCVRDLGKRAVLLGTSMEEMAALREEVEEEGLGLAEDEEKKDDKQVLVEDAAQSGTRESGDSASVSEPPPAESLSDEEPAEDIAMELDSSDDEDDVPPSQSLEEVKRRLLAQLDDHDDSKDAALLDAAKRREMNMRATINMILTVTGEFYGQRDLLEFRDPFASSQNTV